MHIGHSRRHLIEIVRLHVINGFSTQRFQIGNQFLHFRVVGSLNQSSQRCMDQLMHDQLRCNTRVLVIRGEHIDLVSTTLGHEPTTATFCTLTHYIVGRCFRGHQTHFKIVWCCREQHAVDLGVELTDVLRQLSCNNRWLQYSQNVSLTHYRLGLECFQQSLVMLNSRLTHLTPWRECVGYLVRCLCNSLHNLSRILLGSNSSLYRLTCIQFSSNRRGNHSRYCSNLSRCNCTSQCLSWCWSCFVFVLWV